MDCFAWTMHLRKSLSHADSPSSLALMQFESMLMYVLSCCCLVKSFSHCSQITAAPILHRIVWVFDFVFGNRKARISRQLRSHWSWHSLAWIRPSSRWQSCSRMVMICVRTFLSCSCSVSWISCGARRTLTWRWSPSPVSVPVSNKVSYFTLILTLDRT